MQVPCPSLQLSPLSGTEDIKSHSGAVRLHPPLACHLFLALVASFPCSHGCQSPSSANPALAAAAEYLLAQHAGSVLCIASTSVCCPDLTALQSFQVEILLFCFSLQVLLCCYMEEVGGTDGQTRNGGEREDELILPSEYCNWTRNKEQDTILSMTQPGNTCCFPVPLPGLAHPHRSSHKDEGTSPWLHPSTRPKCNSQPGQVKPGSSWYLDRLIMPKAARLSRG